MNKLDQHIKLLIDKANITEDQARFHLKIKQFFSDQSTTKQVVLKRSSFYFYRGIAIEEAIPTGAEMQDDMIYTFDGTKLSKVNPTLYLGSKQGPISQYSGISLSSNNNNNNNNNNNGNNNG
jgi:hypothetical protein